MAYHNPDKISDSYMAQASSPLGPQSASGCSTPSAKNEPQTPAPAYHHQNVATTPGSCTSHAGSTARTYFPLDKNMYTINELPIEASLRSLMLANRDAPTLGTGTTSTSHGYSLRRNLERLPPTTDIMTPSRQPRGPPPDLRWTGFVDMSEMSNALPLHGQPLGQRLGEHADMSHMTGRYIAPGDHGLATSPGLSPYMQGQLQAAAQTQPQPQPQFFRPMTNRTSTHSASPSIAAVVIERAPAPVVGQNIENPAHRYLGPPSTPAQITAEAENNFMDAIARGSGSQNFISRMSQGFSPFYCGDVMLERNRSADITDSENCSLFLLNLPPTLTTNQLVAAIGSMGRTGRIYATHINPPEPDRRHYTCAAKVIFFERGAAAHFFELTQSPPGLVVDGYVVKVKWNRIKTAEQAKPWDASRVLFIVGRPGFVNPYALTVYFDSKLQFQVDKIIIHDDGGEGRDAIVEYRFGSFRCQAEAAKMALAREKDGEVRCYFGPDPCAPEKPFGEPRAMGV